MRICLFSDTHGNLVALEAVLADMKHQGAFDLTIMAGDLALMGPRPAETIDCLRALNIPIIVGNTDLMIVQSEPMGVWAREQIGQERIDYLARLPFAYSVQPAAGHELMIVHANPKNVDDALRPDTPESDVRNLVSHLNVDVLAFGHIHIPYIRKVDNLTLFDIASAGFPRDGDQRAAYGIAEWRDGQWRLSHRRVPYDVAKLLQDFQTCGMPRAERYAQLFENAKY